MKKAAAWQLFSWINDSCTRVQPLPNQTDAIKQFEGRRINILHRYKMNPIILYRTQGVKTYCAKKIFCKRFPVRVCICTSQQKLDIKT